MEKRTQPKPRQQRPKIAVAPPPEVLKRLNQYLMETVGYIKGARSVFVIAAIREKLDREEKKLPPIIIQKSRKGAK